MNATLRGAAALAAAPLLIGMHAAGAAAQTNGFVLHCLSARAAGAGCVSLAGEGTPTSLFRDPAALVAAARPALEVNLSAFSPALDFRNAANPGHVDGAAHTYPMFSAAYVGPRRGRLAWAVGAEPIGGFGADVHASHALLGPGQRYESFFAAMKVGPSLAWEVAPGVSVGASGSLVYAMIDEFRMPFTMPPSMAKGMAGLAGLDPGHYPALFGSLTELTAYGSSRGFAGTAWTGSLGVSYAPSPRLRMSASWSPRTRIDLDGARATLDMSRQLEALFGALVQERVAGHEESPEQAQASVAATLTAAGLDLSRPPVAVYDAATTLHLPQTAAVGARVEAGRGWTLQAEGVWMEWSRAERTMPFVLTRGNSPTINLLVGGDPAEDAFTYPFPLNWKDSWTLKAGVEKELARGAAVRAGYITGGNPVPDNTVFIAFPAISEDAVTLGATARIGRFPLDVAVVHALRETVGGRSGHRLGEEYAGSRTRMSETVVTFGTTIPF